MFVTDLLFADKPETFEERLIHSAKKFDLRPLVTVLVENGYDRRNIVFEGNPEDGSSPGLVESIRFPNKPPRSVIITLNLGLLAEGTLLPAYFFQVIQASPHHVAFYDFLRFFDNHLVNNYLRAAYPEDDGGPYGDYDRLLMSYLRLLGPGSRSTLWWLFQRYFPDFPLHVKRGAFISDTAAHSMKMGLSKLDGTGVLGKVYESTASGFIVELTVEYETDLYGRSWAEMILERFKQRLWPLLKPCRIPFVLRLHVLWHTGYARLEDPTQPTKGRLGYDRLKQKQPSPLTINLFPEPGTPDE